MKYSTAVRNAKLDAIEATIGATPILKIRTGPAPANCAAADSGTVLATLSLPSDWMAEASSGAKTKSGTWQDLSADATGEAAHFRIYDITGTVCGIQGSVDTSLADMIVSTTTINAGQQFSVTTFTIRDNNG